MVPWATLIASPNVRFALFCATPVPSLISFRRETESMRRGAMSPRARSGLEGKEETVAFRATVALKMRDMAVRIEAPSARMRVGVRRRERKDRCMVVIMCCGCRLR